MFYCCYIGHATDENPQCGGTRGLSVTACFQQCPAEAVFRLSLGVMPPGSESAYTHLTAILFCLAPGYFKASKKFFSPEDFCSRRQLIVCHEVLSYCWIGRWDASETQLARKAYSPFGLAKKKN
jgi:hypothetical protein